MIGSPLGQLTEIGASSEKNLSSKEVEVWSDCRVQRVEMPVFEGLNQDGWIFRAERFFSMSRLSEVEKLESAVVSLDREALAWFSVGRWKARDPQLGQIEATYT